MRHQLLDSVMIAYVIASRMPASGYSTNCLALICSNRFEIVTVNAGMVCAYSSTGIRSRVRRCITLANWNGSNNTCCKATRVAQLAQGLLDRRLEVDGITRCRRAHLALDIARRPKTTPVHELDWPRLNMATRWRLDRGATFAGASPLIAGLLILAGTNTLFALRGAPFLLVGWGPNGLARPPA